MATALPVAVSWSRYAPRRVWRAVLLILLGSTLWYFLGWTGVQDALWPPAEVELPWMCQMYPDTGNIAVSLKTGATEAMRRLPSILETSLSCVKDVMVFSDLNQTYGHIQIHDVLSRFDRDAMRGNRDFGIYFDQLRLQEEGREIEIGSLASRPAHISDFNTIGHTAAWALDKYKFLHMLEMAWDLQPEKDWYVFLEPDTYLSWPNLKRWLRTLDPTQRLYIGNAIEKSQDEEPHYFNHGGSGFILSRSALKEFAVDHKGIASGLDRRVHEWWAGDMLVADALYDHMELKASSAVPMFNEPNPRFFPFSARNWCQPAITLHHMQPDDFREIFDIEKSFGFKRLILRDVHDKIYSHGLPAKMTDWDNSADSHEYALDGNALVEIHDGETVIRVNPNDDFDSCRFACEHNHDQKCLSFTWRNITEYEIKTDSYILHHSCVLASAFRLGGPHRPQEFGQNSEEKERSKSWHSGWMNDRITAWVKRHSHCPNGDHWVMFDP